MINLHEIEKKINDVDTMQIFTTDLNGRPVTIQVHVGDIETFFKKGVGFDGSSVPGYGTVDDSDKLLIPLPETFRKVEFKQETLGFLIGKINEEYGERSLLDPRSLLEKVVKQAEDEFGLYFLTAPEHEFFLLTTDEFSKDSHTDNAGYFHADPRDKGEVVKKEIVAVLKRCGIQFEKMHHEVTPSQHEINLGALDPIKTADRTILFSYITKRVAYAHDLHATFMPKPFNGHYRNNRNAKVNWQFTTEDARIKLSRLYPTLDE
ncbi:MAG: glutamine synthetase beta-grasp domain-containing protein [Proteobacteria bacterium]|nr:glutamine synthetase beta-grasp domain-containing protein [Pseudomonadota bacterium]